MCFREFLYCRFGQLPPDATARTCHSPRKVEYIIVCITIKTTENGGKLNILPKVQKKVEFINF